jgi:hypothetical protein
MPPDNLGVWLPIAIIGLTCLFSIVTTALTVGLIIVVWRVVKQRLHVEPDPVVLRRGTPAKARIIGIQETGLFVGDAPLASLQLEIYPPYGTPYLATTRAVIPLLKIPRYQPGAEVAVKIHPIDPSKVELDR